jgi:hypothetical protein
MKRSQGSIAHWLKPLSECWRCRAGLLPVSDPSVLGVERMEHTKTISLQSRCWLCAGAWLAAGFATIIPDPGALPLKYLGALFFPLGVLRLIFGPEEDHFAGSGMAFLIGGWLFYGVLTVLALSQSRKMRFVVVYALLCILLGLTVIGFNRMLDGPLED